MNPEYRLRRAEAVAGMSGEGCPACAGRFAVVIKWPTTNGFTAAGLTACADCGREVPRYTGRIAWPTEL